MNEEPTTADVASPPATGGVGPCLRGAKIGPYRLIEPIGEGGFGEVWSAERHEVYKQLVAVKIIKPGMDSKAVVGRFEAERQALAVMDHPMIAGVLDGGVTSPQLGSRPYFVMELVRGEPITEFCDKHRLTIDERCELMAKVCQAVQHAHTKGVVHRDLKPSNILVGYDAEGKAVPKVIDFGVAKALNQRLTEQTIFTERGQMIGTPEYMSPEQAEMSGVDIDTRSDVYSLGVVLYELLTGVRPFDLRRAALAEMQRVIREVEPTKPSTRISDTRRDPTTTTRALEARRSDARTLASRLRKDLDWVVLQCLAKDRDRRYSTATALEHDLLRYTRRMPVSASGPGRWYRSRKFVGRHRIGVAAVVAVMAIVSGALWTTTAALRAERHALGLRDRSQAFMGTVFGFASPDALGRDATAAQILAAAEEAVDGFVGSDEVLRAAILASLASAYEEIGEHHRALALLDAAVPVLDRHLPAQDSMRIEASKTLGVALVHSGRSDEAMGVLRGALENARTGRSKTDELVLRLMRDLAIAERGNGDDATAERTYRELLALIVESKGERSMLGLRTRADLVSVLIDVGRPADAMREASLVFELARGTEFERAGMQMTRLYSNAAGAARASGDEELALSWYGEAADRARTVLGYRHPGTAVIFANRSGLLVESGGAGRGVAMLDEIIGALEPDPPSEARLAWLVALRAWAHEQAADEPGAREDAARVRTDLARLGRGVFTTTQLAHIDRAVALLGE